VSFVTSLAVTWNRQCKRNGMCAAARCDERLGMGNMGDELRRKRELPGEHLEFGRAPERVRPEGSRRAEKNHGSDPWPWTNFLRASGQLGVGPGLFLQQWSGSSKTSCLPVICLAGDADQRILYDLNGPGEGDLTSKGNGGRSLRMMDLIFMACEARK
jgi:hypothetical protein